MKVTVGLGQMVVHNHDAQVGTALGKVCFCGTLPGPEADGGPGGEGDRGHKYIDFHCSLSPRGILFARLQRSEQYTTASQCRFHLRRQLKSLLQTGQVLLGNKVLLIVVDTPPGADQFTVVDCVLVRFRLCVRIVIQEKTGDKIVEITTSSRRALRDRCPFCGRDLPLTFHHLVPKKLHRRARFRRRYTREQLARGIYVCRACHDGIHQAYSEHELASKFATPEALADDPALGRHFRWLARQHRR